MLSDDDMGLIQQDADLFYKTKEWLNQEVSEVKQILEEQADSVMPHTQSTHSSNDSPRFKGFPYYHTMEGKLECAETLLRRIDEWEKKE